MKNNKPFLIVMLTVVVAFVGLIIFASLHKKKDDSTIDISNYEFTSVIDGNEDNGFIGDHIKGDKNAPLTIFEYADYQCSGCANMNPWMKELLKEYDGKLRVVFRSFPLNIHKNAVAASSAVEAAGLQGFWEEYGDLLFSNQAEWFYSTGSSRSELFVNYFKQVAGNKGDVDKFRSDMASDNVKKKVNFDASIAKSLEIDSTPAFFGEDGKEIDWIQSDSQTKADTLNIFRNYINKQLEQKQ